MTESFLARDLLGREIRVEREMPAEPVANEGTIDPDLGIPAHECIEHLRHRSHEWRERHGEPCHQEWDECAICGEVFDERNPPPSVDPGDPEPVDWNEQVLRETLERTGLENQMTNEAKIARLQYCKQAISGISALMKWPMDDLERNMLHADREEFRHELVELEAERDPSHARVYGSPEYGGRK